MKIAVPLARNRRLLGWCAFSLLLHLLSFAWIDSWFTPATPPEPSPRLGLRLVPMATPDAPRPTPPTPEPVSTAVEPVPPAPSTPTPVPQEPAEATPAAAEATPAALADAVAVYADAQPTPLTNAPPAPEARHYQIKTPPPARLTYAVTRQRAGGSSEALAPGLLSWQIDSSGYRLRLDGVLGQFESEGVEGDNGIVPRSAREPAPAGGTYVTRFDYEAGRIVYPGGSEPMQGRNLDRASVWIALAGIGLAAPSQMGPVVTLAVSAPGGTRIVAYERLGEEELVTAAGRLATVRLRQQADAGGRQVELWLAPRHNWLPVRIRVTEPDGTVGDQVVTGIEAIGEQSG